MEPDDHADCAYDPFLLLSRLMIRLNKAAVAALTIGPRIRGKATCWHGVIYILYPGQENGFKVVNSTGFLASAVELKVLNYYHVKVRKFIIN